MNDEITALSPAKINLTLDIVGTRADGYHELRSIVHTIGIYDTISLRFGGEGLRFRCDKSELGGEENLCFKAAHAWSQAADRVLDCEIELQKRIPVGAGLGGGSSNAATILNALNAHFDEPVDGSALLGIATHLGADVPLFLRGGCALMEGIGEKLTPLRSLEGWLVVVQPLQTLSTPQVFRTHDALKIPSSHATDRVLKAIGNGATLTGIAPLLDNNLTRAATSHVPEIDSLIQEMRKAGSVNSLMTGSGSAVFGVCDDEENAQRVLEVVRGKHDLTFVDVAQLI